MCSYFIKSKKAVMHHFNSFCCISRQTTKMYSEVFVFTSAVICSKQTVFSNQAAKLKVLFVYNQWRPISRPPHLSKDIVLKPSESHNGLHAYIFVCVDLTSEKSELMGIEKTEFGVKYFCQNLPKLHQQNFLKHEAVVYRKVQCASLLCEEIFENGLDACFDSFHIIHELIRSPEVLERATTSVVEEFHQDNVIFLELRTTLRPLPTHLAYLNAVINGIQNAPSVISGKICVRLLLSIDRSKSIDEAFITLNLAKDNYSNGLISGIDLSGNPSVGSLCDFIPILNAARSHDLNAVAAKQIVLNSRIPLELCLTSNVKSKTIENYESHHINYWWMKNKHPICICTDDKGLFNCTLSEEFQLAIEHCKLDRQQVFEILYNSVDMAFCSESIKHQLSQKIKEFSDNLNASDKSDNDL
ncbi:unnamed protein product [Heterobilharzia americana]|nr:unnamed protein product [Heterobilharzia americana]